MKLKVLVILFCFNLGYLAGKTQQIGPSVTFNFLGTPFTIQSNPFPGLRYTGPLSQESVRELYEKLNASDYQFLINTLITYRNQQKLDDWLYYQLIRKTAQQFSPKAENYFSYTVFKWFF